MNEIGFERCGILFAGGYAGALDGGFWNIGIRIPNHRSHLLGRSTGPHGKACTSNNSSDCSHAANGKLRARVLHEEGIACVGIGYDITIFDGNQGGAADGDRL